MRLVLALLIALIAAGASAQTSWPPAQLSPVAPTAGDVIRATFTKPATCDAQTISTVVTGTVVRTTVGGTCIIIDPPLFSGTAVADFGPLAPGTYTYEIYFAFDGPPELRSTQTFTVAAFVPPVPALSSLSIVLLSVALCAAAVSLLRIN